MNNENGKPRTITGMKTTSFTLGKIATYFNTMNLSN